MFCVVLADALSDMGQHFQLVCLPRILPSVLANNQPSTRDGWHGMYPLTLVDHYTLGFI